MRRSAFLFFKGLGLLFAILCGIGTAVLGWFDGADWMNIVTYSIAVTGLILWGWYHFSVRWIDEQLKQNIFTKFPKEEKQIEEENEENFFFKNIREHKWKTIAFLGIILIFIFVSFIADGFFSGRTLVSFLIFLAFVIFMGVISRYIKGTKSVFTGISVLIWFIHHWFINNSWFLDIVKYEINASLCRFLRFGNCRTNICSFVGWFRFINTFCYRIIKCCFNVVNI